MYDDKYVKIIYQTEPIGEHKIILYLTTFDLEAYKKDHEVKYKREIKEIPVVDNISYAAPRTYGELCTQKGREEILEYEINYWIKAHYQSLIDELRFYCEQCKNAKNITNGDDVHCNTVEGNITNCDNVYCNEIKGNVVNCDKIIYRVGYKNGKEV